MINFFRKIRKQLADDNKPLKYARYAIGEIVLVVIGILIALQINNWNESKKQEVKIENLITRLNKQIEINIDESQREIKSTKNLIEGNIKLIRMIGESIELHNHRLFDSLITIAYTDYHINLDLNTLAEAQSNGEIALIDNDSLRVALYKLSTIKNEIALSERITNFDVNNFMVSYMYKNLNWRNIDTKIDDNYREKIGHSKLQNHDYNKLLKDRELENLISSRILYGEIMLSLYLKLNQHLGYIKELLEKGK